MLEFFYKYEVVFAYIGFASIALFVAVILFIPRIIKIIPSDYFSANYQKRPVKLWLKILKNGCGVVLFLIGLLMLFLPGPGIFAILIALYLMDFAYKRRLELYLIHQDKVFNALNWLRKKNNLAPFIR